MNKVLFTIEVVFVDGEIQFIVTFETLKSTTTSKMCEALGSRRIDTPGLPSLGTYQLSVDQFNVFMHWYQSIHIKEP